MRTAAKNGTVKYSFTIDNDNEKCKKTGGVPNMNFSDPKIGDDGNTKIIKIAATIPKK